MPRVRKYLWHNYNFSISPTGFRKFIKAMPFLYGSDIVF